MRAIHFLPIALLALAAPAWAGHRATFIDEEEGRMVIDLADTGDARLTLPDGAGLGLLIGNDVYLALPIAGAWQTIKVADFAAAVEAAGMSNIAALLDEESEDVPRLSGDFRIEPAGTQTVAGLTGKAYRVYGMPEAEPGAAETFVMSDDPVLAPISRLMENLLVVGAIIVGGGGEPESLKMLSAMRALFALGTPLEAGGRARLRKLEKMDVPAATMKLPSTPLTRAELIAGLEGLGLGRPR